jgi:hypothetical protein
MNLDPKEKYKLEYADVGHLRRHYSTVRATLTTFSMSASLAAFASYFKQDTRPCFLVFIGFFMLAAAAFACLVFSYRCEKANLYAAILWQWFGTQDQDAPPNFSEYRPKHCEVLCEMFRDEMNLLTLVGVSLITAAFYFGN